jgi:hypothetical protein
MEEILTFYVIFHQKIFPENIPNNKCFKYLGVNELIKKEIDTDKLKHELIYEYNMPGYNPIYQMIKFCENSVLLNISSPPTPFVGFGQYDMSINSDKFNLIKTYLDGNNKMIGFFPHPVNTICDILNTSQWNDVLTVYNNNNNTHHQIETLKDYPFFLLNTYIIPSWFFVKLQKNLKSLLPIILKFLNYNMRHVAGTLERVNSLIIACALKEGVLKCAVSDSITDVDHQKIVDPFKH